MRYGLPYKGSKNAIAEWIVNKLPKAETFVDLFFGGGAVTHRAMLSGKYDRFIVNDIDARLPKLFLECAYGQHTIKTHPEWVTREMFNEIKAYDAYIALVWSFGNNKQTYIYGEEYEDFKHQLHNALFYADKSGLERYGFKIRLEGSTVRERYRCVKTQIKAQKGARHQIELQSLEALERLQSLEALEIYGLDYQSIPIPPNSTIYCDIPYFETNCGGYGGGDFDHDRFYEWAEQQDNIYISEYWMPDNFIQYAQIEKFVLSAANSNSQTAREKIYTNRRTYERMTEEQKELIKVWNGEQMSLEDLIGW